MTNIIGLKKDVEKLLEQSSTLFGEVKKYFPKECEDSQKEIQKRINDLKSMNAKMLIMAPMKAGKSTLINAICGKRILPTRNTGMTTIPTEIIFKKEKTEPHLELSNELFDFFEDIFNSVKNSPIDTILDQYAHLEKNIEVIKKASNLKYLLENNTVEERLFILNDLVRIYSLVYPKKDLLLPNELPIVYSSFYGKDPIYSVHNANSDSIGTLTIIDAPGKNESGINRQLEQFISSLSDTIHMVLLVFDYTQLKSIASEAIADEVKLLSEKIGKEKIYVVINQIDRRGSSHDSSEEQTSKSIRAILKFIPEEKIFEVSAKYGFAANAFISERKTYTEANFREEEICKDLANVIWPTSPEDFDEIDLDKFSKRADKVYEKSNLEKFLDKALKTIIIKIAPDMIKSGANATVNKNKEMINNLSNSIIASKKTISEIQKELSELNTDKKNALSIKEDRNSVTGFLTNSGIQINESFSILNEKLKVEIERVLKEVYTEYEGIIGKTSADDIMAKPLEEKMVFNNSTNADNMNRNINVKINKSINDTVQVETTRVTEAIKKDFENYCNDINKKIQPLKEKINTQLLGLGFKFEKKYFNNISMQHEEIRASIRRIPDPQRKSKWFNLFDFIDADFAWKIVDNGKQITDYEINLKTYEDVYRKKVLDLSESRKKSIKDHLERMLNHFIERDFNELLKSIEACISSLDDSIKTKNYDQEKQENKNNEYASFINEFESLNVNLENQKKLLP